MYNQLEDNGICSIIRYLLLPLNCPLSLPFWLPSSNLFLKINIFIFFLLVLGISSHSRDFHSHRDVTVTGEGLQILTCARHLWPLSSEGSLACNTYKLQHGVSVISGHIHVLPSVWQVELSLPVLTT